MTALTLAQPREARAGATDVAALLALLAGALLVRVSLAGPARAASIGAALVFAALLVGAVAVRRPSTELTSRVLVVGAVTAGVVVLPALLHSGLHGGVRPAGSYAGWALATTVVATAEEAFLRGTLFDAVARWQGVGRHGLGGHSVDVAVVVSAVAFALLHVPLYGWHALPVDLAVGVALGAARVVAGTWVAPALAHSGADLAGWWLV